MGVCTGWVFLNYVQFLLIMLCLAYIIYKDKFAEKPVIEKKKDPIEKLGEITKEKEEISDETISASFSEYIK